MFKTMRNSLMLTITLSLSFFIAACSSTNEITYTENPSNTPQKQISKTLEKDELPKKKLKSKKKKIIKRKTKKIKKKVKPIAFKQETIINFNNYNTKYISNWYPRKAWAMRKVSHNISKKIYSIKTENGNKFLHASTVKNKKTSIAMFQFTNKTNKGTQLKSAWSLKKYPFLRWKWRIKKLPKGANETILSKLDNAAAIYVVFKKRNIPFLPWDWQPINVLHYVWSTSQPINTAVERKFDKFGIELYKGKFIVLQTGYKKNNKWISMKRNIIRDYKNHFGKWPSSNPVVIGFHTHSDKTKSVSIADYDDLIISDK